jgi:hypothetical protein
MLFLLARPKSVKAPKVTRKRKEKKGHVQCEMRTPHVIGYKPVTVQKGYVPKDPDGPHYKLNPHWRKGHFKMQPYGKKKKLRKEIWVDPYPVNIDEEE